MVVIHLTVIHDVFLQKAVDWLLKENTIIVKRLMADGDFRAECASIMWIWQNVDYEDKGCIFNPLLANCIEIHTSDKADFKFFKDTCQEKLTATKINVDEFDHLYYQIDYHDKIICSRLPAVC